MADVKFPLSREIVDKLEESSQKVSEKVAHAETSIKCIQDAIGGAMGVVSEAQRKIRDFSSKLKELSRKTQASVSAASWGTVATPSNNKRMKFRWELLWASLLLLVSIYGFLVLFVEDLKKYRVKGLDSEETAWTIPVTALAGALLFFAIWFRNHLSSRS
jgi:hypothetical protein